MVLGTCRTVTLRHLGTFRHIIFIIFIFIIFFFLFLLKHSLFSTSLVPGRKAHKVSSVLALCLVPGIQDRVVCLTATFNIKAD